MLRTRVGLVLLAVICNVLSQESEFCSNMPDGNGMVRDLPAKTCQYYYVCVGFELVERLCAGNTAFNPDTGECSDRLEEVDCNGQNPPNVDIGCQAGPVGENCSQFIECSNNEPVVKSCNIDTVFNPSTHNCDHATRELLDTLDCIYPVGF